MTALRHEAGTAEVSPAEMKTIIEKNFHTAFFHTKTTKEEKAQRKKKE